MSYPSFIHIMDNSAKTIVFNRFKDFFGLTDQNRDLVFVPKIIAQRKIAEKRGEATVDFISLWRNWIEFDWLRQRTSVARTGLYLQYNSGQSGSRMSILTVKAVPVKIRYELRFWTLDLDSMTQAIESYLFWKQDFPNMVLYYSNLFEMDMYLKFGPIIDESDYNIYEKGQYFVSMMPIELEGWVLTSFDIKTILTIILDLFLREGTPPNQHDTFISEYIITATP